MNLAELLMCCDGAKRLGLEKTQKKLESLIYKVSSKLLKDFATANKDTKDEEETAGEGN